MVSYPESARSEKPIDAAPSAAEIEHSIAAARSRLLSIQREDGHWCGELEGDTILESEYALVHFFLGRPLGDPRLAKVAEHLRRRQVPEGGWAIYPGGPAEVSASVKAYFVLKLAGDSPDAPHMTRARQVIRGLGGVEACNSFTRIYLSIFGQYEWSGCPAVPPELVLLPEGFVFNIYRMSSWSRNIVVPLSIIWARKPSCDVPEGRGIAELRTGEERRLPRRAAANERLWVAFFQAIDRSLKLTERLRIRPLRERSISRAEAWIRERLEKSDGLGAIFPPIINTLIALRCLGYPADDEVFLGQLRELEKLVLEDAETLRVQPCFPPVWDTAIAMQALRESGTPEDDPSIVRAARWLLDHEAKHPGDWTRSNRSAEPGGWYFEYANEFYPDCDDTAEVLTALSKVRLPDAGEERNRREAISRGLSWLLSMQNADGGWAAFDRDCDNEILTLIPFADHNAMIDPSCEDVTGRTLEALRCLDFDPESPAVRRAVGFLRDKQAPDGTWYGRWGCNYLYGTWLSLRGLAAAGTDLSAPSYRRSVEWVLDCQNEDGGWGELPLSYEEPEKKGFGPSTPSQTAWALMTLFSAGDYFSGAVARGLEYLISSQREDGSWEDESWTGTGFPKVFYLRYHLYATYFPLWALALYAKGLEPAA
jgi:squalene-hopene/tetraprenyl-beta-curcumene cyclase